MSKQKKNKRDEKPRNPSSSGISPATQKEPDKILILTEGDTEKAYFKGVLEGVSKYLGVSRKTFEVYEEPDTKDKKKGSDLRNMLETAMKKRAGYEKFWLVIDNDKRNSFILGCEDSSNTGSAEIVLNPKLLEKWANFLPSNIVATLHDAWKSTKNNYFLSEHDYLAWVFQTLGSADAYSFWYAIKESTPKNNTFKEFDEHNPFILFKNNIFLEDDANEGKWSLNSAKIKEIDADWKGYTELAYSCIAFEFWLILHFEQNKTPFLWVEKSKGIEDDAFDYFTLRYPHLKYAKGSGLGENGQLKGNTNAYTCLIPKNDYPDKIEAKDHQIALWKVIAAYRNAKWLQVEMKNELKAKANKWYEVNPYIKGLEVLIKDLLHLEEAGVAFDYDGCRLTFSFDKATTKLSVRIQNTENLEKKAKALLINGQHQDCFIIISLDLNEYLPQSIAATTIDPNEEKVIDLEYLIPETENKGLVLKLKDPRSGSRSEIKLVLL